MAAANGRQLTLSWDGAVLLGVRTRGYSITNDFIDITTDDDNGWRTLLSDPGLRAIEATVGGITKNQILLTAMMAANVSSKTLIVNLPTTTGTLTGSFFVSSYEETGEHDGAAEFTATLMSSGVVTFVAGV
jgi:predicted secreted protein